jgi:F-type H+-transporting ATPase subunit a
MFGMLLASAEDHHDTFHHVKDSRWFDLPFMEGDQNVLIDRFGFESFHFTKFMLLQVIAFLLVFFIFRGLARRAATGEPVKGRWWNFWEMLAVFVRDDMVRPIIGEEHHHDEHHGHESHGHGGDANPSHQPQLAGAHLATAHEQSVNVDSGGSLTVEVGHRADRYVPFIWTCFFYVLICNLLGAIPSLGSCTANLNVTGALALTVFLSVLYYGSKQSGFVGFWLNQCPTMDLPGVMGMIIKPVVWLIEVVGLFIKHAVLMIRLFANIMGGHTVLAVILGFIAQTAHSGVWWIVTPASVFGQLAIGLLELFVAFVQAYVFSIMATLFISAAVNPH